MGHGELSEHFHLAFPNGLISLCSPSLTIFRLRKDTQVLRYIRHENLLSFCLRIQPSRMDAHLIRFPWHSIRKQTLVENTSSRSCMLRAGRTTTLTNSELSPMAGLSWPATAQSAANRSG